LDRDRSILEYRGDEPRMHMNAELRRDLYFETGYYFQQFDDYDHARERYLNLVQRFPESSACTNAYYNLACIEAIQGHKPQALDYLRKAVGKGFTSYQWLLEDGDLTSIRGDPEFNAIVELARSGAADDTGNGWMRRLSRFMPVNQGDFFALTLVQQRDVL